MIKKLYEKNIKIYFKNLYGKSYHITSCYQGRLALHLLLKSYSLKDDDEVICQALTCKSVYNIIKNQNLNLRLVDIDSNSMAPKEEDLINAITDKTKVVIIQSTAGITPVYNNLLKTCQQKEIRVILDFAQGVATLSNYENVDIFFSTQWNKVYSTCSGGIILTENKHTHDRIKSMENSLQNNILMNIIESLINFGVFIFFTLGFKRLLNKFSKYFKSDKQEMRSIMPLYISSIIGLMKIKSMHGPLSYPYRVAKKNESVIYTWPNNLDFINKNEFPNTYRFHSPIKMTYK